MKNEIKSELSEEFKAQLKGSFAGELKQILKTELLDDLNVKMIETIDDKIKAINPYEGDDIDKERQSCMKLEQYTTSGMINCTYKAMDARNEQIKNSLKILKNLLPPEKYLLVEKSQIEWEKFFEQENRALDILFNQQGTIHQVMATGKRELLLSIRAHQLDSYVKELNVPQLERRY